MKKVLRSPEMKTFVALTVILVGIQIAYHGSYTFRKLLD